MNETKGRKICPLADEYLRCHKEECVWWRDGDCIMVQAAAMLGVIADELCKLVYQQGARG